MIAIPYNLDNLNQTKLNSTYAISLAIGHTAVTLNVVKHVQYIPQKLV